MFMKKTILSYHCSFTTVSIQYRPIYWASYAVITDLLF